MNINALIIPRYQTNSSFIRMETTPGHAKVTLTNMRIYSDGLITIMTLFKRTLCKHQANVIEFLLTGRATYGFDTTETETLMINHLTRQMAHLSVSIKKMTEGRGPIHMSFKFVVTG